MSFSFDKLSFLVKLTIDLGPIVEAGGLLSQMATYATRGATNIMVKMDNRLKAKYKKDFDYSERDRQLFNKEMKDKLYTVYAKGQVAFLVTRKKKKYRNDTWLYVEYRDVKSAQSFLKSTRPKRAKASDF
ncbi:MAG: hypothetical protein QF619_05810 [Candidatus Binatia bacterium]|jgi:hypothetical protein|nr:hypothetical protein [Candidatus Binatia bacterium]